MANLSRSLMASAQRICDLAFVFVAKRQYHAPFLLVVFCLLAYLPGFFTLPPMDRDEPRFAVASRQMLESHDFVNIRFQGEARNKKPVGVYWLQAGVVALAETLGVPQARFKIWLYRVPSLFGAIAAVMATYYLARLALDGEAALLAALLFAASILLGVEARLAKTDALLTATVIASFIPLCRLWLAIQQTGANGPASAERKARRLGHIKIPLGDFLLLFGALAFGFLLKGPVGLLVFGLAVLMLICLEREFSWLLALRPLLGVVFVALCVSPWLILIGLATHGAFFHDSVGGDMLAKLAGAQELHGAPPGSYALVALLTAWPMMPFFLAALPSIWRKRHEPFCQLLLAWLVPAWVVFEAVPTKLPHYVLPLYPVLALLPVACLPKVSAKPAQEIDPDSPAPMRRSKLERLVPWFLPLIPLVLLVTLLCVHLYAYARSASLPSVAQIATCLALVLAIVCVAPLGTYALRNARAGANRKGMALAGLAGVVLAASVYGLAPLSPAFDVLTLSSRLAEAVHAVANNFPQCHDLAISSVDDHEPSLVFLLGTDVRLDNGADAATFMRAPLRRQVPVGQNAQVDLSDCRLLLIGASGQRAVVAAGLDLDQLIAAGHVTGFNINTNKTLDIALYLRR